MPPLPPSMPAPSTPSTPKNPMQIVIIALVVLLAAGLVALFFRIEFLSNDMKSFITMTNQNISASEQRVQASLDALSKAPAAAPTNVVPSTTPEATNASTWMPYSSLATDAFSRNTLETEVTATSGSFKRTNGALVPFKPEMIGKTITTAISTTLSDNTEVIFFMRDTFMQTYHQFDMFAWNQKTNEIVLVNTTKVNNTEDYYLSVYGISGSKLIIKKSTENSPSPCACATDALLSTFLYEELSTPGTELKSYTPASGFNAYATKQHSDCLAWAKTTPECKNQ